MCASNARRSVFGAFVTYTCSLPQSCGGTVDECDCAEQIAREVKCANCGEAEPFHGWDDCLACGVAVALVEDPGYLAFANRLYKDDSAWLAQLNREWARQSQALASQVAA
jgi:hypothetical protein